MTGRPRVALAYHSGSGHTALLAESVRCGVLDRGGVASVISVDEITETQWAWLDSADAIVFGAPTFMGTASAAFHAFAEATAGRWSARAWRDKLAAGFTVSGAMSGDKLVTLQYFVTLASQHGMHWVSLDLLPGWSSSRGAVTDLNRLGITLGVGAQANTDEGPEGVPAADLETARHLGRRIATAARAFTAPRHAAPPRRTAEQRRTADTAFDRTPRRSRRALAKERDSR